MKASEIWRYRNVEMFFHVYGHSFQSACALHVVDVDNVGPSYAALAHRKLRIDDVTESARALAASTRVRSD